jgi:hypothetical protein
MTTMNLSKKVLTTAFGLIFVFPASSNYQLNEWSFGQGGAQQSASGNYELNSVLGEVSDNQLQSTNYGILPGLEFVQMANTPPAPAWTNDSDDYNKLKLVLNTGGNPSDAEFAVAISVDNFVTTLYVQSDDTVGTTLGSEDWRAYASWGSGSGVFVVGLSPNTSYTVKVKARQGDFTEGPWGPTANASTSQVSLTFDIDVAATDQETASPYQVDVGSLSIGSVITASDKIWVDLATNAEAGGVVYVYGTNSGLLSSTTNYTISSVTANLSAASEGYGLQIASTSQSSGGPLAEESPYDGSGETVGIVDTTVRGIFSSTTEIAGGRGSTNVKAKASSTAPAASDYSETLVMVASSTF